MTGGIGSFLNWVRPAPDDFAHVDWFRIIPLLGMHLACLAVFIVGFSPVALAVAVSLYLIRMFAITGGYHRYFSHRAYKTSRAGQFLLGVLGSSAVQRGPLWWAAHHRHHHRHSDTESDLHSPHEHGLWWSHIGWLTSRGAYPTDLSEVPDLTKFPELRFLNRFELVVPVLLVGALYLLGEALRVYAPELGTNGWQMFVWGFVVSTVVLLHGTCTINSLAHLIGTRRYETTDSSRNSFLLALITLGEGWHNNHHRYPGVTRQGFYWWEIDITYYILRVLASLGLVWDLRPPPAAALEVRGQHKQDAKRDTADSVAPLP
ncbi:MAG: acyl-CoA desaturase [Planctomycetota bacterium]|jgi:stearoyl-CoA desaturase (delta-9 desaturase)